MGIFRGFVALIFKLAPFDVIFSFFQVACFACASLGKWRDWSLQSYGWPQFFKHQINLYSWIKKPALWAFSARGVYPRAQMFRGCKVLDLCCGDGTFSYLFFTDISKQVDAVDVSRRAIAYAKSHYKARNLRFFQIDILNEKLPSNDYDFIVWNAAMLYFTANEIDLVIAKLVQSMKVDAKLTGMLPIGLNYKDHKINFNNLGEVKGFLRKYFNTVEIMQVEEALMSTIYFTVSNPV